MKVLLISGAAPVPDELREVIAMGSTSLVERGVGDAASPEAGDADRVVFWAGGGDRDVPELAERYARATDQREDTLVFVTEQGSGVPEGLSPNERYVWPDDLDRLKMAFMTSA
ncbi:hypothetical protein BH23ACI1_BH23ACI1_12060 [soil metagenome]